MSSMWDTLSRSHFDVLHWRVACVCPLQGSLSSTPNLHQKCTFLAAQSMLLSGNKTSCFGARPHSKPFQHSGGVAT